MQAVICIESECTNPPLPKSSGRGVPLAKFSRKVGSGGAAAGGLGEDDNGRLENVDVWSGDGR